MGELSREIAQRHLAAEGLADHQIMDEIRLVSKGEAAELREQYGRPYVDPHAHREPALRRALRAVGRALRP